MAYQALLQQLKAFKLRPGQNINEVMLAEALKISRTPLREALSRLAAEGLFVTRERGFAVPELNPRTVQQLFEARIEIECSLVRLACERAQDADFEEFGEFVVLSAAESTDVSVDRLVELDRQFHETIAKLAGNDEMLRILRNINDRIHLIRWIKMEGKRQATQEEHHKIWECMRRRDATAAQAHMREHILHRTAEILTAIRGAYAHVHTVDFSGAVA